MRYITAIQWGRKDTVQPCSHDMHGIAQKPYYTVLPQLFYIYINFKIRLKFSKLYRSVSQKCRRYTSSAPFNDNIYRVALNIEQSKNHVWEQLFSDPSTYPLILILGCTLSGFAGFASHHFRTNVDIRIDPQKRNRLIRDWSSEV